MVQGKDNRNCLLICCYSFARTAEPDTAGNEFNNRTTNTSVDFINLIVERTTYFNRKRKEDTSTDNLPKYV